MQVVGTREQYKVYQVKVGNIKFGKCGKVLLEEQTEKNQKWYIAYDRHKN